MPEIIINLAAGRTREQKEWLMSEIFKAVKKSLDVADVLPAQMAHFQVIPCSGPAAARSDHRKIWPLRTGLVTILQVYIGWPR